MCPGCLLSSNLTPRNRSRMGVSRANKHWRAFRSRRQRLISHNGTNPPPYLFLPARLRSRSFIPSRLMLRLGLGFNRVNTFAQSGDSQLVLHSDEPLDFGNLRMKQDQSAAEAMAQSFRAPTSLRNLAPTSSSGAKIGIGVSKDASRPLCGSGTTHSASLRANCSPAILCVTRRFMRSIVQRILL